MSSWLEKVGPVPRWSAQQTFCPLPQQQPFSSELAVLNAILQIRTRRLRLASSKLITEDTVVLSALSVCSVGTRFLALFYWVSSLMDPKIIPEEGVIDISMRQMNSSVPDMDDVLGCVFFTHYVNFPLLDSLRISLCVLFIVWAHILLCSQG